MTRYRRLVRLSILFLLLSAVEAPVWAGGAGWGLFAATLGLYAATGGPYGWYDPYYSYPYDPSYSYPPPYTYASPEEVSAPPREPLLQANSRPNLPNMTPPVGEPLPPNAVPSRDLLKVNEQLASVRALLDKKAAAGAITNTQRDSEAVYLTQIERVAHAQASVQKGLLSPDQEEALLRELTHANTLITQNFSTL